MNDDRDGSSATTELAPRTIQVTRLRLQLMATGMPDYKIAAAAGLAPATLSKYARGREEMTAKHLAALSELLGVEPGAIMGWTEVTVV